MLIAVIARSLSERSERNGDEAIPLLNSLCIVTGLLRHSTTLSLRSIPRNDRLI